MCVCHRSVEQATELCQQTQFLKLKVIMYKMLELAKSDRSRKAFRLRHQNRYALAAFTDDDAFDALFSFMPAAASLRGSGWSSNGWRSARRLAGPFGASLQTTSKRNYDVKRCRPRASAFGACLSVLNELFHGVVEACCSAPVFTA